MVNEQTGWAWRQGLPDIETPVPSLQATGCYACVSRQRCARRSACEASLPPNSSSQRCLVPTTLTRTPKPREATSPDSVIQPGAPQAEAQGQCEVCGPFCKNPACLHVGGGERV